MKRRSIQLFLRFARFLLPYWKTEVLIGSLALLGVVLSLTYPYLTKLVIDQAFAERDIRLFLWLTAAGTIALVANGLAGRFVSYLNQSIRARVDFDITRQVFEKMQSLPFSFFSHRSTGDHLYKIEHDIYRVVDLVVTLLPQTLALIPRFLFVFVIVFRLDAKLSTVALLSAPLTFMVPYLFTKRLRERLTEYIENSQKVFARLAEVFSHAYVIKAFSKERHELERYTRLMNENLKLKEKNIGLEVSSQFYASLAQRAVVGLVGLYGGWRVITGDLTLGSLTAIMVYLTQLVSMQGSFAHFLQDTALNLVSCERLEPVLEAGPSRDERMPRAKPRFTRGEIRFEGVHFAYPDEKPVLQGIGFTLEPGVWGGVVGPSGVGKTTMINLLLRLYDVTDGTIRIDGYDIREIDPETLRDQIGFVPQEPFLWNDTVRSNICYGKEEATDEEIHEAARLACADEFIRKLPQGYETVIGENACRISEGQKQRIAIARALIKRPKILIFDEAFASIGKEDEEAILANMERAFPGTTLMLVTHRSLTLKRMHVIYRLESPTRIEVMPSDRIVSTGWKYAASKESSANYPS